MNQIVDACEHPETAEFTPFRRPSRQSDAARVFASNRIHHQRGRAAGAVCSWAVAGVGVAGGDGAAADLTPAAGHANERASAGPAGPALSRSSLAQRAACRISVACRRAAAAAGGLGQQFRMDAFGSCGGDVDQLWADYWPGDVDCA